MAGKKWLGWVRVDVDKWLIEMRGLDPLTVMVYTRLSFLSRNNDAAPGEIQTTMRTLALNMAETEIEKTWSALLLLTRIDSIKGTPLILLYVKKNDSQNDFDRVIFGDKKHIKPPEGTVRVRFEWICNWVSELEQEAESERDRKRREKKEREEKEKSGKYGNTTKLSENQESFGKNGIPPKEREKERDRDILPPIPPTGGSNADDGSVRKRGRVYRISWDGCRFIGITTDDLKRWGSACPLVDVSSEIKALEMWYADNPERRKQNILSFLGKCIARKQREREEAGFTAPPGMVSEKKQKIGAELFDNTGMPPVPDDGE